MHNIASVILYFLKRDLVILYFFKKRPRHFVFQAQPRPRGACPPDSRVQLAPVPPVRQLRSTVAPLPHRRHRKEALLTQCLNCLKNSKTKNAAADGVTRRAPGRCHVLLLLLLSAKLLLLLLAVVAVDAVVAAVAAVVAAVAAIAVACCCCCCQSCCYCCYCCC